MRLSIAAQPRISVIKKFPQRLFRVAYFTSSTRRPWLLRVSRRYGRRTTHEVTQAPPEQIWPNGQQVVLQHTRPCGQQDPPQHVSNELPQQCPLQHWLEPVQQSGSPGPPQLAPGLVQHRPPRQDWPEPQQVLLGAQQMPEQQSPLPLQP